MIMFGLWSEQVQGHNRRINLHRWPLAPPAELAGPLDGSTAGLFPNAAAAAATAGGGLRSALQQHQQQQPGARLPHLLQQQQQQQPASSGMAHAAAGGQGVPQQNSQQQQQQQQQRRDLLCDLDQLLLLEGAPLQESSCKWGA